MGPLDDLAHSVQKRNYAQGRIILALDTDDPKRAERILYEIKPFRGLVKIGLELVTAVGIDEAIRLGKQAGSEVFMDLKFHDIPNTVAGAARAASRKHVSMFNVHCLAGRKALAAARKGVDSLGGIADNENKPRLLGVTLLTSHSYEDLVEIGLVPELNIHDDAERLEVQTMHIEERVRRLAHLADEEGLDGLICSPKELVMLRKYFGDRFVYVTPGVRPPWYGAGDQARVMTPGEAILAGADYVVIGRPITNPPEGSDCQTSIARIIDEIVEAIDALHADNSHRSR